MATRIKPPVTSRIEDTKAADACLFEIGSLQRQLEEIDSKADADIAQIKKAAAASGEPIRKRIEEISARLGAYAEYNKDEFFKDRRSVELSFGVFGYRKSTSIHVKNTTLELLKGLGLVAMIRVKEEPNKEAMSSMTDAELAQVDARRKEADTFFVEPNRDKVNAELLGKSA